MMIENTEIVGVSRNIEHVRELIHKIAKAEANTIVCGETGVGKDLVVQALYRESSRCGRPFIKINCAAIPEHLLESEMFGYERGAFTGAERDKKGKFEQAHGGVLFLDEIGEMSPALQAKLLRVIQDGEFNPLSSEKTIKVDVWAISATNCEIEEYIEAGKFREDLFYRLSTMMIQIEPLRERPEDIPLLVKYYYKRLVDNYKYKPIKIISKDTIEKLKRYSWPGNIRELQNVLQRIQIYDVNDERVDVLFSKVHNKIPKEDLSNLPKINITEGEVENQDFIIPLKKIKKEIFTKIEKEVIPIALDRAYFNVSKASKILGISPKSLHMKINEYGLNSKPDENCKASNLRLFNNPNEYNKRFLEGFNFDNIFEPAVESIEAV
jgi:transcriptional regulator with PAS, ATPase and Fis domain